MLIGRGFVFPAVSLAAGKAKAITLDDVIERFTARPAQTAAARAAQQHVQGVVLSVAQEFVLRLPEGREQSRAIDRLEEAWMWADKAIARAY